jgi:hypothetical protein
VPAEPPYPSIALRLERGEVVPFFGSAASAICRPYDPATKTGETWSSRKPFFPFGSELADQLAQDYGYYQEAEAGQDRALDELVAAVAKLDPKIKLDPFREAFKPIVEKHVGTPPLALIASFLAKVQATREDLDLQLREMFDVEPDLNMGGLQLMLAGIPETMLYVTTNYDDLIERALVKVGRSPNVLVDQGGKLLFYKHGEAPEIVPPDQLEDQLGDKNNKGDPTTPIVFKLHGSIDRKNSENDSYLITEEDYVDFLGRPQGGYIPPYIERLMAQKFLLFLGYSLEDWNVRVILRKLLNPRRKNGAAVPESDAANGGDKKDEEDKKGDDGKKGGESKKSGEVRFWAIVKGRNPAEQQVWRPEKLNIYPTDLREFTDKLEAKLRERRT